MILTETECAYLAGIIDGEGCIRIASSGKQAHTKNPTLVLTVTITNTNEELILWLIDKVGGNVGAKNHPKHKNWKQSWNWRVSGPTAEELLIAVRPYLVIKKAQAALGLKLRSLKRDGRILSPELVTQREEIRAEMNILNARGI